MGPSISNKHTKRNRRYILNLIHFTCNINNITALLTSVDFEAANQNTFNESLYEIKKFFQDMMQLSLCPTANRTVKVEEYLHHTNPGGKLIFKQGNHAVWFQDCWLK